MTPASPDFATLRYELQDGVAQITLDRPAAHNAVNARLGKPRFECSLDALKERWGSCGCFDVKNATEAGPPQAALAR